MQYQFLFYGATVCTVTAINLQNVCSIDRLGVDLQACSIDRNATIYTVDCH